MNVFDRLTTQLSSVETKIEEKHQAMFLLTLLPPSYNTLVGTETLKVKMLKQFCWRQRRSRRQQIFQKLGHLW